MNFKLKKPGKELTFVLAALGAVLLILILPTWVWWVLIGILLISACYLIFC
ncbi:MAG TPA: hypothetical protein PLZ84_02535 [Clostridia bacterium]|nr:hypothetical protein [Clostridia bacterium]